MNPFIAISTPSGDGSFETRSVRPVWAWTYRRQAMRNFVKKYERKREEIQADILAGKRPPEHLVTLTLKLQRIARIRLGIEPERYPMQMA